MAAGVTDHLWGIGDIVLGDWGSRMSRTKAVILILVGIGFGLLALVLAQSGSLVYILWAVSICLVLYGIYLYANKSRQNSH
jgi:hypothetical protein